MPTDPSSGVFYELFGDGPPLLIGLPLMASHQSIFGEAGRGVFEGWTSRLANAYSLCLVDYPSIGRSVDLPPEQLTPDRVCADLLSVMDHAGFERFAFFGYSWSAAAGLQLAARTDRLTALTIGGWPPFDAPYAPLLAAACSRVGNVGPGPMTVLRSPDQYRQWVTWNGSLVGWDARRALKGLQIPKFLAFGADGDLTEENQAVEIASIIRRTRGELEADGWTVVEVPGHGHGLAMQPEAIVPPLRAFLDRALGQSS